MRIIVMAQGKARRFPGKHLVRLAGEPIIKRTARFLQRLPGHHRVTLIAPEGAAWRSLGLPVVTLPNTGDTILDGVAATQYLWDDEHVVYLLGDVVFSKNAFHQALVRPKNGTPSFTGRWGANKATGKPWAEIFALGLYGVGRDVIHSELTKLRGQLWMMCNHLGKDLRSSWSEVRDFTDDIDYPKDLARMRKIEHVIARDGQWA